jgi:hypothetical protein
VAWKQGARGSRGRRPPGDSRLFSFCAYSHRGAGSRSQRLAVDPSAGTSCLRDCPGLAGGVRPLRRGGDCYRRDGKSTPGHLSARAVSISTARGRNSGAVLRATLRAYFAADRNNKSAASALGVSRQAVANRLSKVETRIGQPLSMCADAVDAALRMEELGFFDP